MFDLGQHSHQHTLVALTSTVTPRALVDSGLHSKLALERLAARQNIALDTFPRHGPQLCILHVP